MREAFGITPDQTFLRRYPARRLIEEPKRWRVNRRFVIETRFPEYSSLNRVANWRCYPHVLLDPYSGQILSYQKISANSQTPAIPRRSPITWTCCKAGDAAGLPSIPTAGAAARVQSQTASVEYRLMSAWTSARSRSKKRRRLLGTFGGIRCRRSPVQIPALARIHVTYWRERNQEVILFCSR